MTMYANVLLRSTTGEDLLEDAYVENPIYPPVGTKTVFDGVEYRVENVEFDYDVFKEPDPHTRIAIIVTMKPLRRTR